ncbi:hypothetical protein [Sphingomonas pokkalii]|uniref:Uncharacterized protein n=1 Tax=Sphingomonas pokkalii TaxID=2175090 RepID=A0A2U0SA87_9SPHN|nr:hypothetical protein [Sphingomonas pokkalii]PVX28288.1 hypothetical protein DD559_02150 [Sphingomonas pokkalii]
MRVLFYLPVVTSWWFDNIVEPLIRCVASVAEVHVLAPAPWRNTGLGPAELGRCVDLPNVHWAIVDSGDHASLRTVPADREGLIAYVRSLAPDLVLCRSADFDTPQAFPGVVRYIMEAVTAPFDLVSPANTVHFTEAPFVNGFLPTLPDADAARLDALIAPAWADMQAYWREACGEREDVFRVLGLDTGRPAFLLPLEYEHEENFYLQHRPGSRSSRELVAQAAAAVKGIGTLVVTDHPLNAQHVDRDAFYDFLATLDNVVLVEDPVWDTPPTIALARHVDGALLHDSKSFALAAAFGVPMRRHSRFASAPWLHDGAELSAFVRAVAAGTAMRPEEAMVRRWFGYHLANEAFYPTDPTLTGAMVIDRAMRPVDPGRWQAGIGRVQFRNPLVEDAA